MYVVHEDIPAFRHVAPRFPVNAMHYREWRSSVTAFEELALLGAMQVDLTGSGEPQRLPAARVSPSLFPMLGVNPQLGRLFLEEDDVAGRDRVLLLSDVHRSPPTCGRPSGPVGAAIKPVPPSPGPAPIGPAAAIGTPPPSPGVPLSPSGPGGPMPAGRRACHRTADSRAGPLHAGHPAELAEEAERQVPLRAPAQLPAPEPWVPRRVDPFLHVLDDVHRSRPPEPRHERPRQRIVVLDRPVASPSVSRPTDTFDSVSVSSPSSYESSSTATSIVCEDWPAWNVSVPLAAV